MATGKFCDVLGKGHEARTYRIVIENLDAEVGTPPILDRKCDYCPAALERAMSLILRACEKPAKRKTTA